MRRYIRANEISGGSVTLKNMNTDVIPVADFGCYGGTLSAELEDVFVADYVELDNINPDEEYYDDIVQLINENYDGTEAFFNQVLMSAPDTIQQAFDEYGIQATVVDGSCKWDRPQFYNYRDDSIEFDMTIDTAWVNRTFREFINNPDFVSFLNKNYSSRSGFISFMPNEVSEYEELLDPNNQEYWKVVSAIVTYLVDSDPSIRNDVTYDLYEYLTGNADYATFSDYGIY